MTQGNVEPVAWRWKYKKDTRWNYSPNEQTDNDPAVFEQQPLYAAALALQVDEAMVERAAVALTKVGGENWADPITRGRNRKFARAAIEAALEHSSHD